MQWGIYKHIVYCNKTPKNNEWQAIKLNRTDYTNLIEIMDKSIRASVDWSMASPQHRSRSIQQRSAYSQGLSASLGQRRSKAHLVNNFRISVVVFLQLFKQIIKNEMVNFTTVQNPNISSALLTARRYNEYLFCSSSVETISRKRHKILSRICTTKMIEKVCRIKTVSTAWFNVTLYKSKSE